MTSLAPEQTLDATVMEPLSEDANLPSHMIRLPGGNWPLWRLMGLRGTGFPISELLRFGAEECAALREEILQNEAEVARLRQEALRLLHREVKNASGEEKARCEKAIRNIRSNGVSALTEFPSSVVEEFRTARNKLDSLWTDFRAAFDAALVRQSKLISEVAGTNQFQEAVIWQNRNAFHTAVSSLLNGSSEPVVRNSKRRQHEELVAKYLQRYCAKNDTIGTFGPVGWARFSERGPALKATPGASLIAERNVYFEIWAIEELAKALTSDKSYAPWLVPRRLPYVDVRDNLLFLPKKTPIRISAGQAALLTACDGKRNARAVAGELRRTCATEFKTDNDVYTILEILKRNQLISWDLEIPLVPYPERTLRAWLERIGDDALRKKSLDALAELEGARDLVAAVEDDAAKLNDALSNLETIFTRLTSVAPTRSAGRTYAARTLVYQDSRRDIQVAIGPEILQSIGPALSLLLTSARWATAKVAEMGERYFDNIYAQLSARNGSAAIGLTEFHEAFESMIGGEEGNPFRAAVRPLLEQKWGEILAIPANRRSVEYRSEDLRERVDAAFAAPPTQQPLACYHSPDVMIAAASQEAIRRGEYRLVLGELHVFWNTLAWWLFVGQQETTGEIEQSFDVDLPEPVITWLVPKGHWASTSGRLAPAHIASKDYRIEVRPGAANREIGNVIPAGALFVEKEGDEFVVRKHGEPARFRLAEVYREVLSHRISSSFTVMSPQPYRPRISIDGLIVCREAWRFQAAEFEFAFVKDEGERFVAARRWSMQHGIPRFTFCVSPVEVKPFYVDFDSPIYVDILAKVVRHTVQLGDDEANVTLSEMVPAPHQVWLPDAEGRLYTSELRVVAFDN
jgi:hypothetical protein